MVNLSGRHPTPISMQNRTRIVENIEDMQELEQLWNACWQRTPLATVFQDFAWNRAAARHLGSREQPRIIVAEDSGGDTTILPTAIAGHCVTFLGESLADYRELLTTNPESDSFASAWRTLAEFGLPLRFTALRQTHHRVFDHFSTEDFSAAPSLAHQSAEAFAALHNRMFSRLRKLERQAFRLVERDGTATELLRFLYREKAQADPQSLFCDQARVSMLLEAFAHLGARVQLSSLERDGNVIAAAVAFLDRDTLRFYTNWYDPAWKHYSPGMVLLYEMTRRALQAGLSCDYLTGEQPYKLRMASGAVALRRVVAGVEQLRTAAQALQMRLPPNSSSV